MQEAQNKPHIYAEVSESYNPNLVIKTDWTPIPYAPAYITLPLESASNTQNQLF